MSLPLQKGFLALKCRNAENHFYAEFHYADILSVIKPNVILLCVFMASAVILSVVAPREQLANGPNGERKREREKERKKETIEYF